MKHFSTSFRSIWSQPKQATKKALKYKIPEWQVILGLFLFFVLIIGVQLIGMDPTSYLGNLTFWLEFALFFILFLGVFYFETYLLHVASLKLCKGKSKYKNVRIATAITHIPIIVWILGAFITAFIPGFIGFLLLLVLTIYISILIFGILASGMGLVSSWQAFGMVGVVKGIFMGVLLSVFYFLNKDLVDSAIEQAFFYNPMNTEQPHFVPDEWEEIYDLEGLEDLREELESAQE